jgi:hypothetical protein
MYHLTELPCLPADPRIVREIRGETFIDDVAVHSLAEHQSQWQDQYYLGEDFAGRDDCRKNTDEAELIVIDNRQ